MNGTVSISGMTARRGGAVVVEDLDRALRGGTRAAVVSGEWAGATKAGPPVIDSFDDRIERLATAGGAQRERAGTRVKVHE